METKYILCYWTVDLAICLGDFVARTINQYNGTKIILISDYDLDRALVKELEENNHLTNYIEKLIQIDDLNELVAYTVN